MSIVIRFKTTITRARQFGLAFIVGFIVTSTTIVGLPKFINKVFTERALNSNKNVLANSISEPTANPSGEVSTLGILLLGYGGAGHDGGYLTDAIQVLYIDFEKAVAALISIPRDLWVKSPGGGEMKLNTILAANADNKNQGNLIKSGAPAIKKVISELTGLKIDYFVGIDFVGYQRAIGLNLKGIDVEVGETLDDPWYPIKGEELNLCGMTPQAIREVHEKYSGFELERQFSCRYKHLRFDKGLVHMEGGEALEYTRSRHGSSEGDVSRGKRQQEVLKAMKNKLLSLEAINDLPGFFSEMAAHTSTDIDLQIFSYITPFLQKAKDFNITTVILSPTNVLLTSKAASGAFILVPKAGTMEWGEIQEYIGAQLNLE